MPKSDATKYANCQAAVFATAAEFVAVLIFVSSLFVFVSSAHVASSRAPASLWPSCWAQAFNVPAGPSEAGFSSKALPKSPQQQMLTRRIRVLDPIKMLRRERSRSTRPITIKRRRFPAFCQRGLSSARPSRMPSSPNNLSITTRSTIVSAMTQAETDVTVDRCCPECRGTSAPEGSLSPALR